MIEQFIRLGTHAEAEYLRKLPGSFDGLTLNANLVYGTPAASVSLVYALNKPYVLDPFTYAFASPARFLLSRQKDVAAEVVPKRTFKGLADLYFDDSSFVGLRALNPSDVDTKALAERVIHYQDTWYTAEIENDRFLAESPALLTPARFFAPYFPIQADLGWLQVNVDALAYSLQIRGDVSAVLPISVDVLRASREKVVAAYLETGVRNFSIWIEDFDEDRVQFSDLEAYCQLISTLTEYGRTSFALFGGFFSCVASRFGLTGFSHGLVYGENKKFVPVVGGGQPPPRYYFRPAHVAISVSDAELVLAKITAQQYLQNVCSCAICSRLMEQGDVQAGLARFSEVDEENKFTPAAYALSRFHFLLARRDEVRLFGESSASAHKGFLESDRDFCLSIGAIDLAVHLARWIRLMD